MTHDWTNCTTHMQLGFCLTYPFLRLSHIRPEEWSNSNIHTKDLKMWKSSKTILLDKDTPDASQLGNNVSWYGPIFHLACPQKEGCLVQLTADILLATDDISRSNGKPFNFVGNIANNSFTLVVSSNVVPNAHAPWNSRLSIILIKKSRSTCTAQQGKRTINKYRQKP